MNCSKVFRRPSLLYSWFNSYKTYAIYGYNDHSRSKTVEKKTPLFFETKPISFTFFPYLKFIQTLYSWRELEFFQINTKRRLPVLKWEKQRLVLCHTWREITIRTKRCLPKTNERRSADRWWTNFAYPNFFHIWMDLCYES